MNRQQRRAEGERGAEFRVGGRNELDNLELLCARCHGGCHRSS